MSLFCPDFMFDKIWCITEDFFTSNNIKAVALDIDNTLTTHNSPELDKRVFDWLEKMKMSGLKLIIVSNNSYNRVSGFAGKIGLDFICKANKPLATGIRKASGKLNVPLDNFVLIGDQIFTDILCGNLSGIKTVLVSPMSYEGEGTGIAFKRALEKPIVRSASKKLGGFKK